MANKISRNRNKDMFLTDYYNEYLMEYLILFDKPKYTMEQRIKYHELLLQWYDNWEGWDEEVDR